MLDLVYEELAVEVDQLAVDDPTDKLFVHHAVTLGEEELVRAGDEGAGGDVLVIEELEDHAAAQTVFLDFGEEDE